MMGSFTDDDNQEYQFYDAYDDILSIAPDSDSGSDFSESLDSNAKLNNSVCSKLCYDAWIQSPVSVEERRDKFFNWFGLSSNDSINVCSDALEQVLTDVDRIVMDSVGAVLQTAGYGDESCLLNTSVSYQSNDATDLAKELNLRDNLKFKNGKSELDKTSGLSLPERKFQKEINHVGTSKRVKKGWLNKLRLLTCVVDGQKGDSDYVLGRRAKTVRVHQRKKKLKELSALYTGQDIKAHDGPILTMKFSLDGQYLASAGQDGIVRVWQVVEDASSNQTTISDIDPSCIYFTVNDHSELEPFSLNKEKTAKLNSLRKKTSDSACVVFPPKVFRILDKPLHEFHGHVGEVLDLSWSNNNCLLSASDDKTVRLWEVGCDRCLKIFLHNDYVTCVQFNPIDDDYFISGSIDGKVRIWAIPSCQVIDWIDVKDIVTVVCYRRNAEGVIVGSMEGNCRFYNISDNHLQLDTQICLQSKKKSLCKRITGFQFLPEDPNKVMVTCADSQLRILDGANVIGKYKGVRSTRQSLHASFTSDGKHIVSACEKSNVYVWNCSGSEESAGGSHIRSNRSCEHFSTEASVAIPWCGMKYESSEPRIPGRFSLNQDFCLDSPPRGGSATWPEEKLGTSTSSSSISKSQLKFLRTSCKIASDSRAWGLVIVTASCDGRIRSFHNYGLPIHT